MNPLDHQVAQRLTQYYVLALLLVALLTISALFFVKRTLRDLDDDGRVVNVAGRQRMLSQRLTKLAVLRTQEIPYTDPGDFDQSLTLWRASQEQLREGRLQMEKEYVVRKSLLLDSMFAKVQPVFESMYGRLEVIGSEKPSADTKKEALRVVLAKEPIFLRQMDAIVFRFDAESLERVQYLERVEWLLTIATLTVLFLEGLFVFRPVVSHTKQVVRQLTESEGELKYINQRLEETNQQLVSAQEKLVRTTREKYELQLAEETVRSAALLEGQEEERRRFARELHDGIGQMLTGLKLHVEKIRQMPAANEKQRQRVEDLRDLLQETIQNTREVAFNLMPSVLGDFGLEAALKLLTEQTARSSGMVVEFKGTKEPARLIPVQEIGLYRIAQEGLNNAVKYSEAERIEIVFKKSTSEICLSVKDNGKGFRVADIPKRETYSLTHNGIGNMRTRARLLNGILTISSRSSKGSKVEVKIFI
ncbi:histidine kinase [Persicitalea sp.]|uniref:ATP-binding protein n=1 Tax=Persicitalea sp. TaxID=3100273 RepID=UPI0035947D04